MQAGVQAGMQHVNGSKLSTVGRAFPAWKERSAEHGPGGREALHQRQAALLRPPRQGATAHLGALPSAQREYGLCHTPGFTDLPCSSETTGWGIPVSV